MIVPDRQPHTSLAPREREVLALAQRGLTNPAIAAGLGITGNAVRYHLKELHSTFATAGDRSGASAPMTVGTARATQCVAVPVASWPSALDSSRAWPHSSGSLVHSPGILDVILWGAVP